MSKRNELDEVIGVILGIIGGIALVELLKNLFQKKCSYCNNLNEANRESCKFCGGSLK